MQGAFKMKCKAYFSFLSGFVEANKPIFLKGESVTLKHRATSFPCNFKANFCRRQMNPFTLGPVN